MVGADAQIERSASDGRDIDGREPMQKELRRHRTMFMNVMRGKRGDVDAIEEVRKKRRLADEFFQGRSIVHRTKYASDETE